MQPPVISIVTDQGIKNDVDNMFASTAAEINGNI